MTRTLIAGIGNVFLGDDGFGPEVARRLAAEALPPHVDVVDAGIAGLHLAYRLLDGYELLIAVDIVARGEPPGTMYLLEPRLDDDDGDAAAPDAQSVYLPSVLAMARAMGGGPRRALVVGCEPAELEERMGLSAAVAAAVEPAVRRVRRLAEGEAET
jgi:hydrogenase maturation protease